MFTALPYDLNASTYPLTSFVASSRLPLRTEKRRMLDELSGATVEAWTSCPGVYPDSPEFRIAIAATSGVFANCA